MKINIIILAFWLVLIYDLLEERHIEDAIKLILCYIKQKNPYQHVSVQKYTTEDFTLVHKMYCFYTFT